MYLEMIWLWFLSYKAISSAYSWYADRYIEPTITFKYNIVTPHDAIKLLHDDSISKEDKIKIKELLDSIEY